MEDKYFQSRINKKNSIEKKKYIGEKIEEAKDYLKKNVFKIEVQNLPKVQEVKVTNPSKMPDVKIPPAKTIKADNQILMSFPVLKIPDVQKVEVSNFPNYPKFPEFPKFPEIRFPTIQRVEVDNFPKVQIVRVLNQPDIEIPAPVVRVEKSEVNFPEVQRVDVQNKEPEDAMAVRIVDKKGKSFLEKVFGSGGFYERQVISSKEEFLLKGYTQAGDGTSTVATAGTAVQLPSQTCKRVFIQAHESNSGTIAVGGVNVVAALSGRRGTTLYSTQGDWFNVNNLNLLYIDSTSNGDKVTYYYEN